MHRRTAPSIRKALPTFTKLFTGVLACLLMSVAVPARAQQIHQLYYDNLGWTEANLAGSQAGARTGIAAFATPGAQHVYSLGKEGDVHQLYNVGGGWNDQDLTTTVGGPKVLTGSPVTGFSNQNLQYVYYVDSAQHVHQMLYNNVLWADTDLTTAAAGPLTGTKTQLIAFATTPNNAIHVYYMASTKHIHQISNVSAAWKDEDLTVEAKGAMSNGAWMSGYSSQNLQYVFFVAGTGHVHQLFYNNVKWVDRDLTTLSGSPVATGGSGVTAMRVPGSSEQVIFLVAAGHVRAIVSTNNQSWIGIDLTALTQGPTASATNGMTAFATTPNNQIHLFYVSGNHVNQLFFDNTSWSNTDLTLLTFTGSAVPGTGLAGFSSQNLQYVYYSSN